MAERFLKYYRRLNAEIVGCRKCPRLVEYRETVAREKRGASASGIIGASRFPDSAIPRPVFIFWAWRPRRMARIAPAECLPGIVREIFFIARYIAPDLPISHIRSSVEMACNSAVPISAPRCGARRPAISHCRRSCEIAAHIFETELSLLRPRAILALGGIAMQAYLGLMEERSGPHLRRVSVPAWRGLTISRVVCRAFSSPIIPASRILSQASSRLRCIECRPSAAFDNPRISAVNTFSRRLSICDLRISSDE